MSKKSRQPADHPGQHENSPVAVPSTLAEEPSFLDDPHVRRWLPIIGLILISLAALFPSFNGVYIWDDDQWLTHNTLVTEPDHFSAIWLQPTASPHYYPLVFTTYWIECRLFGLGAPDADHAIRHGVIYHVDNFLLHVIAALLIYTILLRLKLPGGKLGAWLAATIFAIHPVSVESVAWISERKNCLGGALFFASLYFGFLFFRIFAPKESPADSEKKNRPADLADRFRWLIYATTLLFFLMSMFSKTTACVAAPVFLLMIWWRRGKITRHEIALTLPFWIIGAGLGVFTSWLEKNHVGAMGPEWQFSILQRFLIAGTDLWFYLGKLFVPYPVMQIYPRFDINAGQTVTNPHYYLAPIAFIAVLAILYLLRKGISRGPLVALLFFAGVLTPALGFLNFYTMLFTFVADHYQYYACIGIIVLVVETLLWALNKTAQRIPTTEDAQAPARFLRLTHILIPAVLILSLSTLANGTASLYANDQNLWTFNADHNPKCFEVWLAVGASYRNANPPDMRKTLDAYQKAAECEPNDWRPQTALGATYLSVNDFDRARHYLLLAEKMMPDFIRKGRTERRIRPTGYTDAAVTLMAHTLMAKRYEELQQVDKAMEEYRLALADYPDDTVAMVRLGACYLVKGDPITALVWLDQSIKTYRGYAEAWLMKGLAHDQLHQPEKATDAVMRASQLDPNLLLKFPDLVRHSLQLQAQNQKP